MSSPVRLFDELRQHKREPIRIHERLGRREQQTLMEDPTPLLSQVQTSADRFTVLWDNK